MATLDFLYERYIKVKSNLRGTTLSNYKYKYDHYIRDRIGSWRIRDIKYSDVYNFYTYLSIEQRYALKTIEGVHSLLCALFKLAIRDNVISKNPTDGVWSEFKRNTGLKDHIRHALSIEEQRALMSALNRPENIRLRPVITVMLGTGCRISEIVGLRWEDIDLENRTISINHTLNYYKDRVGIGTFKWEIGPPKTDAGYRTIPMLDEVKEAFVEEKEWQRKTGRCCTFEIDGMSGFIFCNKFQGPLSVSSLNMSLTRIVDDYNADEQVRDAKAGEEPLLLPKISCHYMRHTFCTRLCENETNLKVIQSIMGHSDITTTMNIYTDVNERQKVDLIKRLSSELHLFGEKSEIRTAS